MPIVISPLLISFLKKPIISIIANVVECFSLNPNWYWYSRACFCRKLITCLWMSLSKVLLKHFKRHIGRWLSTSTFSSCLCKGITWTFFNSSGKVDDLINFLRFATFSSVALWAITRAKSDTGTLVPFINEILIVVFFFFGGGGGGGDYSKIIIVQNICFDIF